jgi:hypothetical protein
MPKKKKPAAPQPKKEQKQGLPGKKKPGKGKKKK